MLAALLGLGVVAARLAGSRREEKGGNDDIARWECLHCGYSADFLGSVVTCSACQREASNCPVKN